MGLFWRTKDVERLIDTAVDRAVNKATVEVTPSPLVQWTQLVEWLGVSDVSEDALSEATYFACMKVLCESIGKLPIKLLQHTEKDGVVSARDHPLWYKVHDRPNPHMTSTTFWSTVEFNRNHYGNAYVWIEGAGKDTRLWILPSDSIQVWYDNARLLSDVPDIYYLYSAKLQRFRDKEH